MAYLCHHYYRILGCMGGLYRTSHRIRFPGNADLLCVGNYHDSAGPDRTEISKLETSQK